MYRFIEISKFEIPRYSYCFGVHGRVFVRVFDNEKNKNIKKKKMVKDKRRLQISPLLITHPFDRIDDKRGQSVFFGNRVYRNVHINTIFYFV